MASQEMERSIQEIWQLFRETDRRLKELGEETDQRFQEIADVTQSIQSQIDF